MSARPRPDVVQNLRERIQGMEGRQRAGEACGISTGFPALDQILGDGGLKPGSLTEWLGDGDGSGAATLALAVAAHILRQEGACVVIDDAGDFYPMAAAALGIPLERTIVVRPDARMTAMWAWEQALRCPGVAVVFGRVETLSDRLLRRLQLAAETGGGLGFLLRSADGRSGPSWASTRIGVRPTPVGPEADDPLRRRLRVRVERGQHAARASEAEVELAHETSHVPVVPELAGTAAVRRPAG